MWYVFKHANKIVIFFRDFLCIRCGYIHWRYIQSPTTYTIFLHDSTGTILSNVIIHAWHHLLRITFSSRHTYLPAILNSLGLSWDCYKFLVSHRSELHPGLPLTIYARSRPGQKRHWPVLHAVESASGDGASSAPALSYYQGERQSHDLSLLPLHYFIPALDSAFLDSLPLF